jgi:hypothetical protein
VHGEVVGLISRSSEAIRGRIELISESVAPSLSKITARIANQTSGSSEQTEVIMRTFASTHAILHVNGGNFISLLDPEPEYADFAKACCNMGTWPVLVGEPGERDVLLSSPIILYDYPQLAPESAGDLFDGTEIDEILTLRIQTMTDGEKVEMAQVDAKARQILERAEHLQPDQFLRMHSTLREVRAISADQEPGRAGALPALSPAEQFFNPQQRPEQALVRGVYLKAGDRVRIRPRRRADVMDIALAGKIALIESVQEDVESQIHFALVLEDDPGRELGLQRYIGHRFFYSADEVEPI